MDGTSQNGIYKIVRKIQYFISLVALYRVYQCDESYRLCLRILWFNRVHMEWKTRSCVTVILSYAIRHVRLAI